MNEQRTCWWCYWHNWANDTCSLNGSLIVGNHTDKICDRHQTSEEYFAEMNEKLLKRERESKK